MAEDKSIKQELIGLLKYPVIAISIVLTLVGLKNIGNFDAIKLVFGDASIDLKAKQTLAKLAVENKSLNELPAQIEAINLRLENIEKSSPNQKISKEEDKLNKQIELNQAPDKTEVASPESVNLIKKGNTDNTVFKNSIGYMWIGNYYPKEPKWSSLKLSDLSGQTIQPNQLTINQEYFVNANLVVRTELPKNDANYFKNIPVAAIIPSGNKVKILDKSVEITRTLFNQYWVKIEVVQ